MNFDNYIIMATKKTKSSSKNSIKSDISELLAVFNNLREEWFSTTLAISELALKIKPLEEKRDNLAVKLHEAAENLAKSNLSSDELDDCIKSDDVKLDVKKSTKDKQKNAKVTKKKIEKVTKTAKKKTSKTTKEDETDEVEEKKVTKGKTTKKAKATKTTKATKVAKAKETKAAKAKEIKAAKAKETKATKAKAAKVTKAKSAKVTKTTKETKVCNIIIC